MRQTLLALAAIAALVTAAGTAEARPYHRDHGMHHGWARGHHMGWSHHGRRHPVRHHAMMGHHRHGR